MARKQLDNYPTPPWATHALLQYLDLPERGIIWEPSAGAGAIVEALLERGVPQHRIWATEKHKRRADACAKLGVNVLHGDALSEEGQPPKPPALIIGNPPYKLAREFIEHSLRRVAKGGTVAMLLLIDFVGSEERAILHEQHPSDLYVLSRRPRFAGDKNSTYTQSSTWFVWGPGRGGRWCVISSRDLPTERTV